MVHLNKTNKDHHHLVYRHQIKVLEVQVEDQMVAVMDTHQVDQAKVCSMFPHHFEDSYLTNVMFCNRFSIIVLATSNKLWYSSCPSITIKYVIIQFKTHALFNQIKPIYHFLLLRNLSKKKFGLQ